MKRAELRMQTEKRGRVEEKSMQKRQQNVGDYNRAKEKEKRQRRIEQSQGAEELGKGEARWNKELQREQRAAGRLLLTRTQAFLNSQTCFFILTTTGGFPNGLRFFSFSNRKVEAFSFSLQ